jgi:hypothetical protein|tara:strand:+ start:855 stop:1094 length:240 start_codon:yes stop_codon:yes gene_type:complete
MELPEDNELFDVPAEAMIKELQSRFDEMVFLGAMNLTKKTEDITVAFSGSYHAVIGLLEIGKMASKAGGALSEDEDPVG